MDMHDRQLDSIDIQSWQQWSVWLARTGYADLERSTMVIMERTSQPAPARSNGNRPFLHAAFDIDRGLVAPSPIEVGEPLYLEASENRNRD
jgi:hypothetical protein